jgi:hypothetical protein
MECYLPFANERDIELLKIKGITVAEQLEIIEPETFAVELAKANVVHNLTYWIPSKDILEIWVEQARKSTDKRALLLPGRPGGGGVKI